MQDNLEAANNAVGTRRRAELFRISNRYDVIPVAYEGLEGRLLLCNSAAAQVGIISKQL